MQDVSMKAKKAILEKIMKMMDEHMVDGLKAKSPKFMKVEVASEAKPESEEMPEEMESELPSEGMEEDEDEERLRKLYEEMA